LWHLLLFILNIVGTSGFRILNTYSIILTTHPTKVESWHRQLIELYLAKYDYVDIKPYWFIVLSGYTVL